MRKRLKFSGCGGSCLLNNIDELNQNLKAIIGCIDEGIHIINREGITIYYNEVAARLDGLEVNEVIGKHILSVFPSLTEETSTLLTVLKTKKPIKEKQQTFTNFKGNQITTVNSTIPIFLKDEVIGALEVSRDITRVKELSEKIIDLQKELYPPRDDTEKDRDVKTTYTISDIVGADPQIEEIRSRILMASKTDSSVLIYGETGTGKELVAQSIHNASRRRKHPFIAQNCAAMPETLLESMLFGTVKGGFTGARNRPGLFELAHRGTILLDEINSMPVSLQAKLLRILEEGCVRRIGSIHSKKVDVRVVATTNIEPWVAVEEGQLRKDLYYRLNVLPIRVPPLRERKEDIPLLVRHFIRKLNSKLGKKVKRVSPRVMEIFNSYPWPGNVRELENALEGAMNLAEDEVIQLKHLPQHIIYKVKESKDALPPLRHYLEHEERKMIEKALRKCGGNITRAAELLDIPRQTLQYRLRKFGLK